MTLEVEPRIHEDNACPPPPASAEGTPKIGDKTESKKDSSRSSSSRSNTNNPRKDRRKHRKKQNQIFRPNSPAAYPSGLPIRNQYYERVNSSDDGTGPKEKSGNGVDVSKSSGVDNNNNSNSNSSKTSHEVPAVKPNNTASAFLAFRVHYLIVHIAIMLADGLQGTHLYVLYEGYGYTVASLYSLGFLSGAITSPFIGPWVDKIGRRRSAVAYCALEVMINMMEQYDNIYGLVVSRVVGGITTNLLFTVFESWLVTEHRSRGFPEDKLEIVMRDSVVASNLSAIASGCMAHYCASVYGPTGPFSGAVACTLVALVLVATRWEENYGSDIPGMKSINNYMSNAFTTIISDSKIYRIGIIQGLTEGALQTFVFLWSPALRHFSVRIPAHIISQGVLGIDENGNPAYGLIFGAFMACGALGGLVEPFVRKLFCSAMSDCGPKLDASPDKRNDKSEVVVCTRNMRNDDDDGARNNKGAVEDGCVSEASDLTVSEDGSYSDGTPPLREFGRKLSQVNEKEDDSDFEEDSESEAGDEKPVAVELLASICFLVCACLLSTPMLVDENNPYAFTISLSAFLVYEFVVGLYMPCEGVLRSIYMPNDSICSLMTMLRVIVNVAVALGVISTNYIPFATAFAACSGALVLAAILQLSLVQKSEWKSLSSSMLRLLNRHEGSAVPTKSDNSTSSSPPQLKSLSASFLSSDSSMASYDISDTRKNQ